ncbi:uncharacterized protein JCM6883_007091 [Sporobolomyces salmoneus]|uniref:uncharacterized protein n=1 Tax=Sporobolomyces salmoneus TaxID=183962 RepID=UPI00317EF127
MSTNSRALFESSSSTPSRQRPRRRTFFPLALISLSVLFALSSVTALPSNSRVVKRGEDEGGLSKDSKLSEDQVEGIETILNRTASYSWEIGTHLEALISFSFPSLSVYSSAFDKISPSTSPLPTQVLSSVSYLIAQSPPSSSQLQIVRDGSAADPVSIAPFYVLSNYTLEDNEDTLPTNASDVQGARKETVIQAVNNQVEAILQRTPRTSDGAISHRSESTELWSDFMYMVPPFLAYYGVMTKNTSLIDEAYTQSRLYRQYLLAPSIGLWRHIALGSSPDPGLWSTGNGWAANGMLRVVGALQNSDYEDQYSSEIQDLTEWTREIIDAAWKQPMRDGLLYNYLNETDSFAECSGTAALSAATYRLSQLTSNYSRSTSLTAAESAYQTILSYHLSSPQGVRAPVVNPMDYSSQLQNVRNDASGNVSPEGEAFVLMMEASRRDWIEGGGDAEGLMGRGTSTSAGLTERAVSTWIVATMLLTNALFAGYSSKNPRLSGSRTTGVRQTKSAFQLSPRLSSSSSPPPSSSTGFFGWTRWYKGLEHSEKLDQDERDAKEELEEVVSDEVTNLFKEAFRKRKQLLSGQEVELEEPSNKDYSWPDYVVRGGGGENTVSTDHSNRTSVSSSLNDTLPSIDLDDFSSYDEDYSPPRSRHTTPPVPLSTHLRSTQSNITLKAPQLLRRVASSSSLLINTVELPPSSPHSPQPSPTLSSDDDFTLSPTLLSYSTTSLSSESTTRSSSTVTSTTSSVNSSVSSLASSSTSIRSRFSTLRKAASSAALNFFNPKSDSDHISPPLPLPTPTTASFLLRDVLLKHDQSTPDSPSPPFPPHPFNYVQSSSSPYDSQSDSYDLESPSSAFPPFDPFTTFDYCENDPNDPSLSPTFPPQPSSSSSASSPRPRLLARQRSFIDPQTRSLRTAPSLLCTPPTPDKTEQDSSNGLAAGERMEEGSSEGSSDEVGARQTTRSRRKRGKRKSKSVRNLRDQARE